MSQIRERENARLGDPVRLKAEFFSGGVLFDPVIDRVEIYRGGDGTENGGVLVDVVDVLNVVRLDTGIYELILDLFHAMPSPGGSPSPNTSPTTSPGSPEIPAQMRYYDRWVYRESAGKPEVHSIGLSFYLYPATSAVVSDTTKFRFEMKPDRKRIVKGENLDIRLGIIPVPLYRSNREPIVDYLLPISTMRVRIIDATNNQFVDWTSIRFTGKEGILPTNLFASLQLGEYHIIAELILPNSQSVRYPRLPVMLVD